MMASVSMLSRTRGAATAVRMMKGSISAVTRGDLPGIGDATGESRCGDGLRRGQMGARLGTLAALEIAVGGADDALAEPKAFAAGEETHRTARLAPLETGRQEDAVEAL